MPDTAKSQAEASRQTEADFVGTVVSLMTGAGCGLLIPAKGEVLLTNVVVGALAAFIIWKRHRSHVGTTCAIILATLVVLWPAVFLFLDWLHRYYR